MPHANLHGMSALMRLLNFSVLSAMRVPNKNANNNVHGIEYVNDILHCAFV